MIELEEMKMLWGEMSAEIDKQKKLTDALILKMIRSDYRNKIRKIIIPEAIGSLGCIAGALFILFNVQQLNNWYLLGCGIMAVIILVVLPVLSLQSIYAMQSVNIAANSYKQSVEQYSKGKLKFVLVQKLSFYLGAILLLVTLPVMGMLISGKDLFIESRLWIWYAVGFPFFYVFFKWVFKKYSRITVDAENVLKELEQ